MVGHKKITEISAKNRYTITLDDDPTVHKLIEHATGIPSQAFFNTQDFLSKIRHLRPLGVFIDVHIGLESVSGIDLVPQIKAAFPSCPILIITSDLDGEVLGQALESGADDFIRKPIQGSEVQARFRARLFALREHAKNNVIRYADLSLEPVTGRLSANGKRCLLSPLESKLLLTLMKAQGNVLSKQALKLQGWGRDTTSDNALIRKIFEIRKVVTEMSRSLDLNTAYGRGFYLVPKSLRPKHEAA